MSIVVLEPEAVALRSENGTANHRDARGRFTAGNPGGVAGRAGRKPTPEAEHLRSILSAAADTKTLAQWTRAFRSKLEQADPWATEFLFDRMIGRPKVALEVGADDRLLDFMAWMKGDKEGA